MIIIAKQKENDKTFCKYLRNAKIFLLPAKDESGGAMSRRRSGRARGFVPCSERLSCVMRPPILSFWNLPKKKECAAPGVRKKKALPRTPCFLRHAVRGMASLRSRRSPGGCWRAAEDVSPYRQDGHMPSRLYGRGRDLELHAIAAADTEAYQACQHSHGGDPRSHLVLPILTSGLSLWSTRTVSLSARGKRNGS